MKRPAPCLTVVFAYLFLQSLSVNGQDCTSPQALCGQSAAEQLTTADGDSTEVPAAFCFSEAPNAIFFSFQTIDLNQFPGLDYTDSTATVSIEGLTCIDDTTLGQTVNLAVFSATDACEASSYSNPLICETDLSGNQSYTLSGLLPSTTYYVMISGATGSPPATGPADCTILVSVAGPAVTYDLDGNWYPENNENRLPKVLFDGETVVLTGNSSFPALSWSGPDLNATTGNEVTADPEGVGVTDYLLETTINGCIYNETISVIIREAIRPDNVFTPNGDGYNDTWFIQNITAWKNAQINVFSRWGAKVFQATNYQNNWNGDGLPSATYYYVIELNPVDGNIQPITGSVTILR